MARGIPRRAAFLEERLAGAVAWAEAEDELDIDRLMVAPAAHRRGVGVALVREVLRRAASRRTVVSTARDNIPARALYEGLSFSHAGEQEILPGLWVTRYAQLR